MRVCGRLPWRLITVNRSRKAAYTFFTSPHGATCGAIRSIIVWLCDVSMFRKPSRQRRPRLAKYINDMQVNILVFDLVSTCMGMPISGRSFRQMSETRSECSCWRSLGKSLIGVFYHSNQKYSWVCILFEELFYFTAIQKEISDARTSYEVCSSYKRNFCLEEEAVALSGSSRHQPDPTLSIGDHLRTRERNRTLWRYLAFESPLKTRLDSCIESVRMNGKYKNGSWSF